MRQDVGMSKVGWGLVHQVVKWMLSTGDSRTMATTARVVFPLDGDNRAMVKDKVSGPRGS